MHRNAGFAAFAIRSPVAWYWRQRHLSGHDAGGVLAGPARENPDPVRRGRLRPRLVRLSGVPVSENFFDVLGVKPLLGRAFTAQESAWNGPKVVMLGYALWERRFKRDPNIVGTSLVINDAPAHGGGRAPAVVRLRNYLRAGQRHRAGNPVCQ